MTNNPTIDGVSRVSLQQVLEAYDYADSHPHKYLRGTTNWCAAVAHKLNELQRGFDAPEVERQEPVTMKPQYLSVPGLWINCADDDPQAITFYKQTPDVAALQSTIAQLQARVHELESGRVGGIWFPRELGDGLAELIAEKARVCGGGAFDIWEEICERFGNAPPAPVASDKYDEVLLPFLAMMRNELHANAGKGDRPGWLSMTPGECLLEIYYHLGKLQKGVNDGNELWITEYSADVANMAMMLADICGRLDATAALNEVRK